jgi:hypothetical protein
MIADVYASASNPLGLVPVHTILHGTAFGIYGLFVTHSHLTMAVGCNTASAIILNGAQGCTFDNTYLCSWGGAGGRPTIEIIEQGGGFIFRAISIEGTVDDAVRFTHGVTNIFVNIFFEYCGFGAPANYAIHAENNTEIRQLVFVGSYSNNNVLLYDVYTSDFSGLRHYDVIVTNITIHNLTHSKILLELGDTLTLTGASIGNTVQDNSGITGESLVLDALGLKVGSTGSRITFIKSAAVVYDPGNLLDGAAVTPGVALAGVEPDGKWVTMAVFTSIPVGGNNWQVTSYPVSGAVYVTIRNITGAPVDLPSGTLLVVAMKIG